MIKYNLKDINDWNFDGSNVAKVYRNGAVVYYKLSGESPTPEYQVCFAVVDDITQYSEREFEDVYDKATGKWYKLNNLGEYEEYGVYASGRTSCEGSISPTVCVTTYEGKLTIDEGYEYEWDDSSWANLGEISGDSRLPQGYTEVEYIENTSSAYINTEVLLYDSTTNSYNIQCKCYFQPYGNDFEYLFGTEGTSSPYAGVTFRYYQSKIQYNSSPSNVSWTHINNGDGTSGITASCSSTTATNGNNPLTLFCGLWSTGPWRNGRGKIYSFKVTKNDTLVRDLVPCKRDSDDKYGMYDLVTNTFYLSPNNVDFSGGSNIGGEEYPKYYEEKDEPLNNLTFNTLAEAQTYARNNCVYDGLKATINGDRYYFDSSDENGWVERGSRLPQGYTEVEYVQNTASGSNTSSTSRLAVAFEDSITNSESAYTYEVVGELNLGSQTTYFDFWGNNYVQLQRLDGGYGLKFNARAFGKQLRTPQFLPNNDTKYRMKIYQGVSDTYPQFEVTDITAGTTSKDSLTNSWSGGGNNSTKLGLFHYYNVADSGARITPAKIYEVIVTDREGNELCHSVPCTRDSDGNVGFYNLVRDEFDYDASGELTLIAGPIV